MGVSAFVLWWFLIGTGTSELAARNLVLLLMVLLENCHVFNCRSEYASAFRVPLSRNYLIIIAVIAAQGLHILSMYVPFMQEILGVAPVSFGEWLAFLAIALVLIGVMEGYKIIVRYLARENHGGQGLV